MTLSKQLYKKIITISFAIISCVIVQNNVFAYDIFQELNNGNQINVRKEYLPVDEAFKPEFIFSENGKLSVSIQIANDYYLYQHLLKASIKIGNCEITNLQEGIFHHDDFMGDSKVYFNHLSFDISFDSPEADNAITIIYQGCTKGMCYPPVKNTLQIPIQNTLQDKSKNEEFISNKEIKTGVTNNVINKDNTEKLVDFGSRENVESFSILSSFLFLLIGLSLSFTPCVFPMYPILSIVLFGTNKVANTIQSKSANFSLAFFFVQGIALTYTAIGILCSYIGTQTHAFLQQPIILIIFSAIFVLLSLSMIGLFDIEIPKFITNRLQNITEKQKSRSKIGAFIIGIITSLVCSPCTTAPVSASLLYTIQQGNLISGSINLYLMGFGMGIPMLIIGAMGKKILPKSGLYLTTIKQILGIISLSVPIILLNRIIPNWVGAFGIAILICAAVILIAVRHFRKQFFAILAITILSFSYFLYIEWISIKNNENIDQNTITVHSLEQLQNELKDSQYIIVDFYASWCTSCKQYDEETYANAEVKKRMENIKFIKIDLSNQNIETDKISTHFNLVGLPSVALIKDGEVQSVLSGFYDAKSFMEALDFYFK